MRKIMKIGQVIAAVVFVASLVCIVLPVKAAPLDTYHSGWKLIRETASQDGDSFGAVYDLTTEGNFANKDSSTVANGGPYHIRSYPGGGAGTEFQSSGGAWMFVISGECFNGLDDTFSFHILGWSRINGMLQVIAEGDGVLGDQAVIAYPDDSADALGATASDTAVTFTHSGKTFTVTNAAFADVSVNMMAYVSEAADANITSGFYEITTYSDANSIAISGVSSDHDDAAVTVQINPAFWADVINLDETTKWPSVAVYNSEAGSGQMAFILIDMTGLEWIQFVVYAADAATNEEAGNITIYGRPY